MQEAGVSQAAPTQTREYQHLLRGPRFAWWRPALAMLMGIVFVVLLLLVTSGIAYVMMRSGVSGAEEFPIEDPWFFAFGNLLLAALVPASMLAVKIAHRDSAGFICSVVRRIRWRWMLRCCVVIAPLYVAYVALGLVLEPPAGPGPEQAWLLLLLIFFTTPFQAAGEEFLVRGLVLQNVGAWIRQPRVSAVVAIGVSTALFVAAHGNTDPWIVIDLAITGVACGWLAWRTGGLEAPIALHAVNNVVGMTGSVIFGGWGEGFIDGTSRGQPLEPLLTLVVCVLSVRWLWNEATRCGIARVHAPVDAHGITLPA
jgi:membrane protease YdiL (CAAX protease family)